MKKVWVRVSLVTTALAMVGAVGFHSFAAGDEQSELRETMLNAVDHYKTLKADYIHHSYTPDGRDEQLTVSLMRQPGVGARAKMVRADGVLVENITDGTTWIEHDTDKDEYRRYRQSKTPKVDWAKIARHFKATDGRDGITLRPDSTELGLGWVGTAIFPQEFVLGTYDASTVTPLGDETLLGRVTKKLQVETPNGYTFVINADPESGVLLRLEIHEQGKMTDLIEATSYEINQPVNPANFVIPDLKGKKVIEPRG